jgi:hypothetical protein
VQVLEQTQEEELEEEQQQQATGGMYLVLDSVHVSAGLNRRLL